MKISNQGLKFGVLAGLAEGVYVVLIGLFMFNLESIFSDTEPSALIIVSMLLIFVFSAGISGLIVFGYPVYLITQKKIREAVQTVLITLTTIIIIFALVIFTVMAFTTK